MHATIVSGDRMLSYRHAFHAGNHADVLKHLILTRCLDHLNAKDKPYLFVDTHAGAGIYDFARGPAREHPEHEDGIDRLWSRNDLPPPLAAFRNRLRELNGGDRLRRYPGSPWLAARLARECDRLRFYEIHEADVSALRRQLHPDGRRLVIAREDGFAALKSQLPPPSRRGMVLIDPSYELKGDYAQLVTVLRDALGRFATGTYLVWHPLLPSLPAQRLPERLKKLGSADWLHATLAVRAPQPGGRGLHGSGLFVINPPWTLEAELREILPWLALVLAQDERSDWTLETGGNKEGRRAASADSLAESPQEASSKRLRK